MDEKTKEGAQIYLDEIKALGGYRVPNEKEKTPTDLVVLGEVNMILERELEEIGIEMSQRIDPKKVHFLSHMDYSRIGPSGSTALVDPLSGHMYVDDELKRGVIDHSDLREFKLLLHESIHLLSHSTYYVDQQRQTLDMYRTGYSNTNTSSEEDVHGHFDGLNEAVTETISLEITNKNKSRLTQTLRATEEDWERIHGTYESEREILSFIIAKVAEKNSESEEEVWKRFKRSIFTGELMHLRDIEHTFGKGALRMVAAINSGTVSEERGFINSSYRAAVNERILEYLQTSDDEEHREILAEVLLNEREHKGFLKRRGAVE